VFPSEVRHAPDSKVSDDAVGALVELFFNAFPSVGGESLGPVLDRIIRIIEEELLRRDRRPGEPSEN
jgi:hypothetical protein